MNRYLLDVNVVIAILDQEHDLHLRARNWFEATGHVLWMTCPTTENGVVRILSGASYPELNWTPAMAMESLDSLRAVGDHEFAPDSISILDGEIVDRTRLLSSKQVTDTYLLAMAVQRGAILVTLDRRLSPIAVHNGADHILQLV